MYIKNVKFTFENLKLKFCVDTDKVRPSASATKLYNVRKSESYLTTLIRVIDLQNQCLSSKLSLMSGIYLSMTTKGRIEQTMMAPYRDGTISGTLYKNKPSGKMSALVRP